METRTFDYKGIKLSYHYLEGRSGTIVLMHGYSFNSTVWEEIGLVKALNDLGLSVIGLDVPGYPQSSNRLLLNEAEIVSVLEALIGTLEGRVFLLGSSASVHIALKFAEDRSDALAGMILVAPVSVKNVALDRIGTRVIAIWGSDDDVSPPYRNEDAIRTIRGAEVVIISGAGHACYLSQPKTFIRIVSEFINGAG
jgi:pimeloyl-ACP methyl ester carboxylesterase